MMHPGSDALLAHRDGALDAHADRALADHLADCAECRAVAADLRAAEASLAAALALVDSAEPHSWDADGAPALRIAARAPRARTVAAPLRWAAGILLLSGAAAGAAVLGGRPAPVADRAPAPEAVPAAQPAATGAVIAALPVDGRLEVVITAAGAGTHIEVAVDDGVDVRVEVNTPTVRFGSEAGSLSVDLAGSADTVVVTWPRGMRAGALRVHGATVAEVRAGGVTVTSSGAAGVSVVERTP